MKSKSYKRGLRGDIPHEVYDQYCPYTSNQGAATKKPTFPNVN